MYTDNLNCNVFRFSLVNITLFYGSDRKWGKTIISQNELNRSMVLNTKIFLSATYKWVLDPSVICECGAFEEIADQIVRHCP